jgi:N-acetylmuramoyl-L-alanine amidase
MRIFFFFCLFVPFFSSCAPVRAREPISPVMIHSTKPLVVLDAGHGGWDRGAQVSSPHCEEKKMTLLTAQLTKKYLEQLGYQVILTRARDFYLPLSQRVSIANRSKAEIFISLHFNSCPNKSARGIEVYYCNLKNNVKKTKISRKLARSVLRDSSRRTNFLARSIKSANFVVIKETKMPAILVEGGFLTNLQERQILRKRETLDTLAKGIAEGVDKFFRSK